MLIQKRNVDYWEVRKHDQSINKKRKIENEIASAHEKYLQSVKENEKPLEQMTVCELKEKLKTLGKTKTRKKEKNTSCIGKGNRKQHLKHCAIYLYGPRRKKPVCEGYANIKGADICAVWSAPLLFAY